VLVSSQLAYFMDKYGVVIDNDMIDNLLQTNVHEATELLSLSLAWRTLIFGLIPAYLILIFRQKTLGLKTELISKGFVCALLLILMAACFVPLTASYITFVREHKSVRFYSNPIYFSYSVGLNITKELRHPKSKALIVTADDARHIGQLGKNKLVILVIGETARADHFSLNGYNRETNPELKKQEVISMKNVTSCGTSTAVSVPCMFSPLTRKGFDAKKSLHYENALDVLQRVNVAVLWRDNNSDSKGVSARVPYENFKDPRLNPACEVECRDIGMLSGLSSYIDAHKGKDILIVLHQMGNHGPAYYKRYPPSFKRFTPVCETNELSNCTTEQVINAYDNAILYTDHFLAQTIELLKQYDDNFKTAMLYVSDHGESLGEYGIFLHGAPFAIAPKAQVDVPAVIWMGKNFDYKLEDLRPYENYPLSHDDLFCTLLVAFEIDTKVCESKRPNFRQLVDLKVPARGSEN
jgi:lipid A ethanolaminephosphotransferase